MKAIKVNPYFLTNFSRFSTSRKWQVRQWKQIEWIDERAPKKREGTNIKNKME